MKFVRASVVRVAIVLVGSAVGSAQAGTISYLAWTNVETGYFFEGLWPIQTSCCAGFVDWTGNTLTLDYRKSYGSAAWANSSTVDASQSIQFMPIPDGAIGVYFDISSTTNPAYASFQINQGLACTGLCIDSSATWWSFWHYDPSLQDWYFNRGGVSQSYPPTPVATTTIGGLTSVSAWFDDPLLFVQRSGYFNFFATSTFSGPPGLIDGTTTFQNVSWIMTDEFPQPPPPPPPCENCEPPPTSTDVAEPSALALISVGMFALFWLGVMRRRAVAEYVDI